MITNWFHRGAEAGRTESWMNIETTMVDTYDESITGSAELIYRDTQAWEKSDHFWVFYGSKILGDAGGDYDKYESYKTDFWEGYLSGRAQIGIDIYKIAVDIIKRNKKTVMFNENIFEL